MSETHLVPRLTASDGPIRPDIDGTTPAQWAAPESLSQLQQTLAEASGIHGYVVFVGRASHIVVGNPLSRVDLAISMARLNGILSYEPADMTVTAEAGVTLADLERTLSEHGQWLPLDPPPGDESTLGGLLAANVFGPLRHRYGTARDWLLGLRAVLADGTTIKSGGRVVKNVSGYDLHKVFVGSLGTLGAIAEVTLKVAPLPRVDRTFTITCGSAAEAAGVIMSAHEATLSLAAAELLSPTAASALTDTGAWTALVRVAGGSAATGRTADDLHQLASLAHGSLDEVDVEVWPRWRARFAPGALGLRMSVMPSRAGEVAESLDRALAGAAPHVSSTVSAGLIRLNLTPRDEQSSAHLVERARQIAKQRGGFTVIDSAPLAYKRTVDVFGAARADIEIMRRLKQEFDPKGILSPGRFVGRI